MRRGSWAVGCALGLAAWAGLACGQDDEGFTPLLNGSGLAGWQEFGGRGDSWTHEDGRLACKGEGGGWLGTERDYRDFVLRLEFRLSPGSNSGIYLRAPADTSHISRTGLEIQILDDPHPSYKDLKPWQYTGAIYHVAPPERGHLKPTGEWNAMEIRAEGPHIVVTLNGTKIVDDRLDSHPDLEAEHTGLRRPAGRIGLQNHSGGRVEFRNVRVREVKETK